MATLPKMKAYAYVSIPEMYDLAAIVESYLTLVTLVLDSQQAFLLDFCDMPLNKCHAPVEYESGKQSDWSQKKDTQYPRPLIFACSQDIKAVYCRRYALVTGTSTQDAVENDVEEVEENVVESIEDNIG